MTGSVRIPVDLTAFNATISAIESDVHAAVRPAAQAGADVIYRAVVKNVQAIGSVSGNLAGSIYQAFSPERSGPARATYHVSWNARKAPHGQLVEFGHIQRYAVHLSAEGKWYTVVRPSMRGKPKPGRRASQAVKDAYYVLREGGPRQVAAQPFVRPAYSQQGAAVAAVNAKFWEVMNKK